MRPPFHEQKRSRFREQFKTLKGVFDLFTEENLFKLIRQGYFTGLQSPVKIGKEANVFSAATAERPVIIKIYRLQTCDFTRMRSFLIADPRFNRGLTRRRQVIFTWAQREYRNLLLAREAGVRVPTPLTCLANVLVMEFIGRDEPAPRVKDRPPSDPVAFMDDLFGQMRKLHRANLVHGDLSKFNVLNLDGKPVLIDFSQATTLENPNARMFLERDVRNVCTLAADLGVECSEETLLKRVTSS